MNIFLVIFTYFSYCFIAVAYTIKIAKYIKLPVHLRWELYPVMHEEKYHYGGSYLEQKDWWDYGQHKSLWKALRYLLRDYLYFESYLKKDKVYWFFLYIAHISFLALILFQILIISSAIIELNGIRIAGNSASLIKISGIICFITGIIGNMGLFIIRLSRPDLRIYTNILIYFGYMFYILLCIIGLLALYYADSHFLWYREFWKGMFILQPISVSFIMAIFIMLINLHLVYLPFTKAIHYITRLFAFFLIRWDDKPNKKGGKLEKKIIEKMNQKVSWSGPHIEAGKRWIDLAKMDKR